MNIEELNEAQEKAKKYCLQVTTGSIFTPDEAVAILVKNNKGEVISGITARMKTLDMPTVGRLVLYILEDLKKHNLLKEDVFLAINEGLWDKENEKLVV